jgi:hypothetical protein
MKSTATKLLIPVSSWVTSNKLFLAWLVFFLISIAISFSRVSMPFISQWDEMYHLSYVQYASEGVIPAPGFPMNDWAKIGFSCYPVSLLGMTTDVPCGEIAAGSRYPTGGTNSASVWPPIYYVLAAILMVPIKFIFGVADNVFAARYATALIWAAGTSLLSLLVYKKSKSILLASSFAMLTTGLSLFGQSASFISPHSTVPLILFSGLMLAFWLDKKLDTTFGDYFLGNSNWKKILSETLLLLGAVLGYGVFVALTVPHAVPVLLVLLIYIWFGVLARHKSNTRELITVTFATGLLFALAGIGFQLARQFWSWQMGARSVPWPADVNPAAADVDAKGSYPDLIQQLLILWWEFWPNGLQNPWLQGQAAIFVENVWVFLLPTLVLAAVATLGTLHWLRRIAIGLIVTAPVASNLAFATLQIALPERYGMVVVLLGLLGLASDNFNKSFRVVVFLGALATYILSFFYNPLPFSPSVCPPTQFGGAFGCVLVG